jgi:transcriptional regulator
VKGHFPEVKFVRINSATKQWKHVLSELEEIEQAETPGEKLKETVDLLHSLETYFRILKRNGADIDRLFKRCIQKNYERGYYEIG